MVVDTFVRELQRSYRWRPKRLFGLSSVNDVFTGVVTVIQRFDSALRLNGEKGAGDIGEKGGASDSESDGEGAGEIEPSLGACYDVAACGRLHSGVWSPYGFITWGGITASTNTSNEGGVYCPPPPSGN